MYQFFAFIVYYSSLILESFMYGQIFLSIILNVIELKNAYRQRRKNFFTGYA